MGNQLAYPSSVTSLACATPKFSLPCGGRTWGRGLVARETGLGPFGQGVPGSCMPMICSQEVGSGGHIYLALQTFTLWGGVRPDKSQRGAFFTVLAQSVGLSLSDLRAESLPKSQQLHQVP